MAFAVGLVGDPVFGPLAHQLAVPEVAGGEDVAAEDKGGAVGGGSGVFGEEGFAAVGDLGGIR